MKYYIRTLTPDEVLVQLKMLGSRLPQPVMLHGKAGQGKSAIAREYAIARGLPLVDVRLTTIDPEVDFRGPLVVTAREDGRPIATFCRPEETLPSAPCVLFLDEFSAASVSAQKAALQLVLDRRIGPHALHPDTVVLLAGNRLEDRAGSTAIIAPMANRITHYCVETTFEAWRHWAIGQTGEINQAGHTATTDERIHSDVLAFLSVNPHLLNDVGSGGLTTDRGKAAQEDEDGFIAFATPRSWHVVSSILHRAGDAVQEGRLLAAVQGTIGEAIGASFIATRKEIGGLPPIDTVLRTRRIENEGKAVEITPARAYGLVFAAVGSVKTSEEAVGVVDAMHRAFGWSVSREAWKVNINSTEICRMLVEHVGRKLDAMKAPNQRAFATSEIVRTITRSLMPAVKKA